MSRKGEETVTGHSVPSSRSHRWSRTKQRAVKWEFRLADGRLGGELCTCGKAYSTEEDKYRNNGRRGGPAGGRAAKTGGICYDLANSVTSPAVNRGAVADVQGGKLLTPPSDQVATQLGCARNGDSEE